MGSLKRINIGRQVRPRRSWVRARRTRNSGEVEGEFQDESSHVTDKCACSIKEVGVSDRFSVFRWTDDNDSKTQSVDEVVSTREKKYSFSNENGYVWKRP